MNLSVHMKQQVVKELLDWSVIYFNSFRTNPEYTRVLWVSIKFAC